VLQVGYYECSGKKGLVVTAFIVIAVVGVVLLIATLLFDGVLDVFNLDMDGGFGFVSGASIGGLVAGVGLGGMLGTSLGVPVGLIVAIAAIVGILLAGVAVLVFRVLKRAQGDEKALETQGMVGSQGTIRAVGENKTGVAAVTYLGAPRTMRFTTDYTLKPGDTVIVTQVVGPETIRVEPTPTQ